jgi:glycosyltransferase involved in cell wall biosynthesis
LLVAAVGALVRHKDHATFIRASSIVAASQPDVRFAVFGEGPLHGSLKALVSEVGLENRFCLAGHVPDTVRSLGDIDIFVMPSREEGLGTACIEAMMAGLPIVATKAGGLGELAGNAFRPVEPGCPDALAREIERLLRAPGVREAAGLEAKQRSDSFSAETMVMGTLRCYEKVAHQVPMSAPMAP